MVHPRLYQQQHVDTLVRTLENTGRSLLVMATGTGKTLTSAFALKQVLAEGERILFLSHTIDILRQTIEEYRKVFTHRFSWGMLVGNEKSYNQERFLFATLQSMREWKHAFSPEEFAYIVVDESHHGQAESYRETITYFTPKGLIGLTATPDRMDGKDIRELFGEEVHPLTLEEALARAYVTPVSYKLMTVGSLSKAALTRLMREVTEEGRRVSVKQLNETIFIEQRDEEIARAILSHQGRGIVFCESILHAENFAKFLPESLPYHSALPANEQHGRLEAFRNGHLRFLLTIDKLNEGIDIPDAELIVFLRATDSRTIFLQQLGRGLRLSAHKPHVTVLDFVANAERIVAVSHMKDRVRAFLPAGSFTLDTNIWNLDGAGIDFSVTEELVDVMHLLARIQTPFYATYEEAAEAARRLGITILPEYKARYKEDPRLPSNPPNTYKDCGWISWPVFFGTDPYATYEETVDAARRLGVSTVTEYKARYKEDPRLPSNPDVFYKDCGWISWPVFLGTREEPLYATYEEAVDAARRLGVSTVKEYHARYKEDPRLPSVPDMIYKDCGWVSWPVFLGTDKEPLYTTYEEAVEATRRLGFSSQKEYKTRYKEDLRLPSVPDKVYKDRGWISWPVFLGTREEPLYATYEEAADAVRRLGISNKVEYKTRYKEDLRLPSNPNATYKGRGWISWPVFLGTDPYATCEEASDAARRLGILLRQEYYMRYKEDPRLPSNPGVFYKDCGWISWPVFLGKKN